VCRLVRLANHSVSGGMAPIGNHTFRATGITAYLGNGGALEHAQTMAAHESPRTTKLYDRTQDRLTQDEVEKFDSDDGGAYPEIKTSTTVTVIQTAKLNGVGVQPVQIMPFYQYD
jgi:hypothetical protein